MSEAIEPRWLMAHPPTRDEGRMPFALVTDVGVPVLLDLGWIVVARDDLGEWVPRVVQQQESQRPLSGE